MALYTIASQHRRTGKRITVGCCSDLEIAKGMCDGFQETLDSLESSRQAVVLDPEGDQVWPE